MTTNHRLLSLDFVRGLIMVLLAAESTLLYEHLSQLTGPAGVAAEAVKQFFHVPWRGLHFWDLIQPGFMTIAGVSLFFSTQSRLAKGDTPRNIQQHVFIRSLKLLICGVALHCVYAGKLVWELWNVLSQLAFTLLFTYFVLYKSVKTQIAVSLLLIFITELLYRFSNIPGFNQPFVPGHNFGSWADLILMGKLNSDNWVAINFIPTTAHTIWGALIGRLLASSALSAKKLRILIIAGLMGLITGYALDSWEISPIIKRICTASFVLTSGGWVLLLIALCYWLIDVRKAGNWILYFMMVGMNPIFIYLFFETVGHQWLNEVVAIFTNGITAWLQVAAPVQAVLAAIATLLLEWYICYWLYQKKIFIRL